MKRDFVSISSFSSGELMEMFHLCRWMKEEKPEKFRPFADKTAALIFEKPSLRTHVSFAVGVAQLGGQSIFLSQQNIGLSTREAVRDIAETLSRYNDLIVARTMKHETVTGLAEFASVPVVNALTDLSHPCQIMADAFTLMERNKFSLSTKIVFIGDGNNVVNSWIELAEKLPVHFVLACPKGYEPDAAIVARTKHAGISNIEIVHDPFEAARDADVLYTDVWVSMGQDASKEERQRAFQGYQVNVFLLTVAKPECVVMHCLPAHRGEEITAEVLEGSQSIALDQAENRLHAQKGVLAFLMGQRVATVKNIRPCTEEIIV